MPFKILSNKLQNYWPTTKQSHCPSMKIQLLHINQQVILKPCPQVPTASTCMHMYPVPTAPLTTRFGEKEERAQPRVNLPMSSTKPRVIPLHTQTKIGLLPQPVTPQILEPAPPYTNSFQDFLYQPLKLPPRITPHSPIPSFQTIILGHNHNHTGLHITFSTIRERK